MKSVLGLLLVLTCYFVSVTGKIEDDFVRITCTPVQHKSLTRCTCKKKSGHQITARYATYLPTKDDTPVECRVELLVHPAGGAEEVENECHQVPHHPSRIACSARLRRSLVSFVRPTMILHSKVPPVPVGGKDGPCRGQCLKWTSNRGCVKDVVCLECLEKFRSLFPGVDQGFNPCN